MKFFIKTFLILFLVGCASTQRNSHHQSIDEAALVWLQQTAAISVDQACINSDGILLKYQAFSNNSELSHVFYGEALWEKNASKEGVFKESSLPLNFINPTQWQSRSSNCRKVEVLSAEHWQAFRFYLAKVITPQEPSSAAVILSDQQELVFYYDANEELNIVNIKDKPLDVNIVKSFSQDELNKVLIQALYEYLDSIHKYFEQVLLVTTPYDDYVQPFIYADLKNQFAVSLHIAPIQTKYQEGVLRKGVKSVDHVLLDSHVLGVMTRPFSSAFRFLEWTKSTTATVFKPNAITFMQNIPVLPLYEGEGMRLVEWEEKLDKVVGNKASKGAIKLLISGDQYFPRLIETIQSAKESIIVRTFIFDNDDYALKIADILKEKSREKGIKVQVLLDGMGTIMGEGAIADSLPAGFVPPKSIVDYLKKDSKIEVRVRPNALFKADHIKTTIIDEKICFTGGMNIGREYRYDWHDLMMEVEGPIVAEIIREFQIAWEHAGSLGDLGLIAGLIKSASIKGEENGYPIRTLYTRANDPQIYRAQLAAIKEAKNYIWIHNPYFSDNTILFELIKARRRGVDVRVVLPVHGNHEIMNASNVVTANIMFRNGIRVFFYPGMTHIKAAIYDGWMCSGSANFDRLSFYDNLELNLATSHASVVDQLKKELFEDDFIQSMEMKEPLQSGLKERLAEFFAEQL